jgi:hypothetical protein
VRKPIVSCKAPRLAERMRPSPWACVPAQLCSRLWPRPFLVRCQRDQARLLYPAGSADTQYQAQLERGANRPLPGGRVRRTNPMMRRTTIGRRRGGRSNPSEDFESARWPRSLGEPSRFRQPSAERQRSSSFTRISTLIIAADSRTIHSEYVGKTTGPETMLAANRLVGRLLSGQKTK